VNDDIGNIPFEELAEVYRYGTSEDVDKLAAQVGKTRKQLRDWMYTRGVRREPIPSTPSEPSISVGTKKYADKVEELLWKALEGKIQALPPVELLPDKRRGKIREQAQISLFSDCQVGIKTASYNSEIFRARVRQQTDSVIRIGDLHRYQGPIKELYDFCLGDLVHGERVGKQVNLDELECGVHSQILDIFVPAKCEQLANYLKKYNRVKVFSVEGNHGWPAGRYSAYGSNWDVLAMELVKAKLANNKRIEFNIERSRFYQLAEIKGHHFLLLHGDQINMYNQVPWYGLTTRTLRWKGSIEPPRGFAELVINSVAEGKLSMDEAIDRLMALPYRYATLGHFHSWSEVPFNDVDIFLNGTFVTGDEYPLKRLGLGSRPCQWTLGVDTKHGVTWRYPLTLD
jgi:hypothetical protein